MRRDLVYNPLRYPASSPKALRAFPATGYLLTDQAMTILAFILNCLSAVAALAVIGAVFLFGHRDIPLRELKAKYTNSASAFISVDGMEVHFRDEGNRAAAVPIVLLHGTASSLHTFEEWAGALKQSNRVIRLDLPAYGLTGPFPDRNYSMAHYTAFLRDFLAALNVSQCVLAGNSLGGQIAWNFALEQPGTVQKLILLDAAGYPASAKSVPIAFSIGRTPVLNKILTYITPRFIVKSSVENVYFDKSKVTDALVTRYYELTLREGNRQAFVDRFRFSGSSTTYQHITRITQPTLLLWGAKDLLIPVENAYKFQKDLPNSTLVVLSNVGHTPMEESPAESLEPVLAFLKK
jgi:pimeloyl-ACP methyl ester carboxylesterase